MWKNTMTSTEISIHVPWGIIAGKWWGATTTQPVLAVHGWQDNASTYDTLVPLLSPQISILCIDLPGHGKSSHYPRGMTYFKHWEGVNVMRRIVNHYGWKNVKLMGHSMGGEFCFLYAAAYPEEVDSLVCLDIYGPHIYKASEIISKIGKNIDTFLKNEKLPSEFNPSYNYKDMIDTAFMGYGGSVTREKCKILMERGMEAAFKPNCYQFTRDVQLRAGNYGMLTEDQVLEFASRITCKVLNIRAVPGLGTSVVENYMKVLNKIRENAKVLEYHEVQGTHHVHLNEPEKLAQFVSEFLLQ